MKRVSLAALLVLAVTSIPGAPGGLFDDIYRGLEIYSTPLGGPSGQRVGRLRVVPHRLGQGYTVELDRSFGADGGGRPEVFDLGAMELELSGQTAATLGYTSRGFLIGNGQFNANNLAYTLRGKTGAQDFALAGTLAVQGSLEVNQLGFYTGQLEVNNTNSSLTVDGVLARGDESTNFDIGPISVKGNIYYDALISVLGALGVDTTTLEQLSPKSPVDVIVDAVQRQMPNLTQVAGAQFTADTQLPPVPPSLGVNSIPLAPVEPAGRSMVNADAGGGLVPEPSTLLLASLGGVLVWSQRRR